MAKINVKGRLQGHENVESIKVQDRIDKNTDINFHFSAQLRVFLTIS